MTFAAVIPFVVCVLGALGYVLAGKAEAKEMGRLAFAVALLALMFALSRHTVHL